MRIFSSFPCHRRFLAPELVELCSEENLAKPKPQRPSYSRMVDVWALGVILHLMICGDFPFDNYDEILAIDPTYGSLYFDYVAPETVATLDRIFAKDPDTRYTLPEILGGDWLAKDDVVQAALLQLEGKENGTANKQVDEDDKENEEPPTKQTRKHPTCIW